MNRNKGIKICLLTSLYMLNIKLDAWKRLPGGRIELYIDFQWWRVNLRTVTTSRSYKARKEMIVVVVAHLKATSKCT